MLEETFMNFNQLLSTDYWLGKKSFVSDEKYSINQKYMIQIILKHWIKYVQLYST